jgi:hypothetical protein
MLKYFTGVLLDGMLYEQLLSKWKRRNWLLRLIIIPFFCPFRNRPEGRNCNEDETSQKFKSWCAASNKFYFTFLVFFWSSSSCLLRMRLGPPTAFSKMRIRVLIFVFFYTLSFQPIYMLSSMWWSQRGWRDHFWVRSREGNHPFFWIGRLLNQSGP